jgi:hypothetical protein
LEGENIVFKPSGKNRICIIAAINRKGFIGTEYVADQDIEFKLSEKNELG